MPPRKRAAAKTSKAGAGAGGGSTKKKVKVEPVDVKPEPEADGGLKAAVAKLKTEDAGRKRTFAVDSKCTLVNVEVVDDYDCMLNQTNIGHNNNKFYVIQLLHPTSIGSKGYWVWTRWGRVGEPGQTGIQSFIGDLEGAKKFFCKKFTDKTKNKWENRASFQPHPGKYTLIEVEEADEGELELPEHDNDGSGDSPPMKVLPSKLEKPTQELVKLIFDSDMFKEQMSKFEIDVKKMPLGKLSKGQIAKGFEAMEAIEEAIKNKVGKSQLSTLSSRFYTVIPHSFGRKVPPVIDDMDKVQAKKDMLLVLGDIELAQSMQKEKKVKKEKMAPDEMPNPLDVNYELLKCKLELLKASDPEFKIVQTYINHTGSADAAKKLLHVWKMDREGEGSRFSTHDSIDNRRLLWHGTNVAVVAAICKTGLRIMPHSGGRVGRGIYLASEHSKSRGYAWGANNGKTVMFLNEAALGKEHHIEANDCSLTKAPKGCDCVIAKGQQEPDPSKDVKIKMEGHDVAVPQGRPVQVSKHSSSRFYQSEYLVYKESQNRMRYMCLFKF